MQFIYPYFLWALTAMAIPLIIHLFHFRRFKKIYFSNVHLLKEIKEETSTRSRLRNLLILLARMAALAFLIFAFAQPILTNNNVQDNAPRAIEIFVDNSFSMQAEMAEVPLLTIAKDKALEILLSHEERDRYLILSHDLEAKHQRYVDQKTAVSFVEALQISPTVTHLENVSRVFDRLGRNLKDFKHQRYFLSDFQANISSFNSPIDSSIDVTLLPIHAVQENNVGISDMSWEAPIAMKDQSNRLAVSITNYGQELEEVELRLLYQDQDRPLGTVQIPPNTTITDSVTIHVDETGWHQLELVINDYPVQFDNRLFGSFEIREQIDILSIHNGQINEFLDRAFESIGYYHLRQTSVNTIRYETFDDQELIVLDDVNEISSGLTQELERYIRHGGNLLIFPSILADVRGYNTLLDKLNVDQLATLYEGKKEVSRINTEEFVFRNVYETKRKNLRLPQTTKNWSLSDRPISTREALLTYRDGQGYLNKYQVEKGNLYLSVAPLSSTYNDLVINAEIWIPMLYKMALSSGVRKPLYYTIGIDDIIPTSRLPKTNTGGYVMKGKEEFIPGISGAMGETYIDVRDQIKEAGHYTLSLDDTDLQTLSFNYDRVESEVSYADIEEIQRSMGQQTKIISNVLKADLSQVIREQRQGVPLWKWSLILALLMLLIETLLIKYWKT